MTDAIPVADVVAPAPSSLPPASAFASSAPGGHAPRRAPGTSPNQPHPDDCCDECCCSSCGDTSLGPDDDCCATLCAADRGNCCCGTRGWNATVAGTEARVGVREYADAKGTAIGLVVLCILSWGVVWGGYWATAGYVFTAILLGVGSWAIDLLNRVRSGVPMLATVAHERARTIRALLMAFGTMTLLMSALALTQGILFAVAPGSVLNMNFYSTAYANIFAAMSIVSAVFYLIVGGLAVLLVSRLASIRFHGVVVVPEGGVPPTAFASSSDSSASADVAVPQARPIADPAFTNYAVPTSSASVGVGARAYDPDKDGPVDAGCCYDAKAGYRGLQRSTHSLSVAVIIFSVLSWGVAWGPYWSSPSYLFTLALFVLGCITLNISERTPGDQRVLFRGRVIRMCGFVVLFLSVLALAQSVYATIAYDQKLRALNAAVSYGSSAYVPLLIYLQANWFPVIIPGYIAFVLLVLVGAIAVDLGRKLIALGLTRTFIPGGGLLPGSGVPAPHQAPGVFASAQGPTSAGRNFAQPVPMSVTSAPPAAGAYPPAYASDAYANEKRDELV